MFYDHIYVIVTVHFRSKIVNCLHQPLRHSYVISSVTVTLPFEWGVDIESGVDT